MINDLNNGSVTTKPRIVFIGDTSLGSPHFGCQLVGQTFREQFGRTRVELIASLPYDLDKYHGFEQILKNADLLVINGEGSIHHGRFHHLIKLASEYPSALVNCVYQENPIWPELKDFLYVSTRESYSANEINSQGVECHVVPDVLFASSLLNSFIHHEPIKDFGFTDNAQKTTFKFGPFKLRLRLGRSPKQTIVADYLSFLCQHKRMCIGRFHAAIAASVLGIPFSTWDSNTWKMRGLMQDMGLSHLHFNNREEAMKAVPLEFDPTISEFVEQAKVKIETMFDTLASIANERVEQVHSEEG